MKRWRRLVIVVLGYFEALIFSGIIFGWPSLIYILQQEGIYSNLCHAPLQGGESPLHHWKVEEDNLTSINRGEDYGFLTGFDHNTNLSEEAELTRAGEAEGGGGAGGPRLRLRCSEQDNEFTLLYTVAAIMYGLTSIFIGFSLDLCGLWATRFCGSFITTAGFFCLAFTTKEKSWLLWPAMNFLSLGTSQLRMSCYQFSNLFPSRRTTIFYAYGSAFSISATIFTIVQYFYKLGVSYKILGLTLAFMSLLTFPVTFLMPIMRINEHSKEKKDKNKDFGSSDTTTDNEIRVDLLPIKNDGNHHSEDVNKEAKETISLKNEGSLKKPNVSEDSPTKSSVEEVSIPLTFSLFSLSAVLHLLWHFVNFFMILFYSVSFNSWVYKATDDSNQVAHYTGILGLCQLIGPLFIPLSGMFTDWRIKLANKVEDPVERLTLTLQASTFGTATATIVLLSVVTCKMFVDKTAIYLSMFLIAICRPLVHSGCTAYVRTRFPGSHFNRLFGIFTTVVSIVMSVQYPIFIWMFSSDDNFKAANWMLMAALVLSLLSPGHMMFKNVSRKYAIQQLNYSSTGKKNVEKLMI